MPASVLASKAVSYIDIWPAATGGLAGSRQLVEEADDRQALAVWLAAIYGQLKLRGVRLHLGLGTVRELFDSQVHNKRLVIPPGEFADHTIIWCLRSLCAPIIPENPARRSWRDIEVDAGQDLPSPADIDPDLTLPLTFIDAVWLAQRWREREIMPRGYAWPEEEYWATYPDKRPSPAETERLFRQAIIEEKIPVGLAGTDFCIEERRNLLPGNAWIARDGDRIDWSSGRINKGLPLMDAVMAKAWAEQTGASPEELAQLKAIGPTWHLALLGFHHLVDWAVPTFDLRCIRPRGGEASVVENSGGCSEAQVKRRMTELLRSKACANRHEYETAIRQEFLNLSGKRFKDFWRDLSQDSEFTWISRSGRKPSR